MSIFSQIFDSIKFTLRESLWLLQDLYYYITSESDYAGLMRKLDRYPGDREKYNEYMINFTDDEITMDLQIGEITLVKSFGSQSSGYRKQMEREEKINDILS